MHKFGYRTSVVHCAWPHEVAQQHRPQSGGEAKQVTAQTLGSAANPGSALSASIPDPDTGSRTRPHLHSGDTVRLSGSTH